MRGWSAGSGFPAAAGLPQVPTVSSVLLDDLPFAYPAGKDAECRKAFQREMIGPLLMLMRSRVPDRKETADPETQCAPLAALHGRVSRVTGTSQTRLPGL